MSNDAEEKLMPCPFCSGGETVVSENRLSPTMNREGALISAQIKHWCSEKIGVVGSYIEFRGRERSDAIKKWNQRG